MKITSFVALLFAAVPLFADTDVQKSFDKLKSLAGTWEGKMTTEPKVDHIEGTKTTVTLRVTSMGHVLMHEMVGEGRPDDPITMLYLENDALALTHYCDAGNRPRMTGHVAEDGKSVHYSFADLGGGNEHGHMHGAAFTFVDEDRHIEEWTFMLPGDKPIRARVELRRKK